MSVNFRKSTFRKNLILTLRHKNNVASKTTLKFIKGLSISITHFELFETNFMSRYKSGKG